MESWHGKSGERDGLVGEIIAFWTVKLVVSSSQKLQRAVLRWSYSGNRGRERTKK